MISRKGAHLATPSCQTFPVHGLGGPGKMSTTVSADLFFRSSEFCVQRFFRGDLGFTCNIQFHKVGHSKSKLLLKFLYRALVNFSDYERLVPLTNIDH